MTERGLRIWGQHGNHGRRNGWDTKGDRKGNVRVQEREEKEVNNKDRQPRGDEKMQEKGRQEKRNDGE